MMASDPDVVIALLTGLVVWSLRAMALGGLVAFALAIARVKRAGARLTSWTVVLIAVLAMPALTLVVPTIRWVVPILSVIEPAPVPTRDGAQRDSAGNQDALPAGGSELTVQTVLASVTTSGGSRVSSRANATRWPVVIGVLYVLVVAILLARLLVGARAARRLLGTATSIDDVDALERLRRHAEALGLARTPPLFAADALVVPITTGIANPVLLLPANWREWSETTTDAVFRHELAHVARRDAFTHRLSLIHRAICWFSPFSWWLSARLSQLAEYASDEAVLISGIDRGTYGEILVGFLSATHQSDGLADWQIAMARRTGAEQRIARILDWPGDARRIATSALVVFALLVTAAAGLVAAVQPSADVVTLPAVAPSATSSASMLVAAPPPADERRKIGGTPAPGSRPPASSANTSTNLVDVPDLQPGAPSSNSAAQVPTQTTATERPIFTTTALTVLVDLVAYDIKGAFVPDLEPEEFQVLENGIEQRIASLIQVTARSKAVTGLSADRPVSHYILSYLSNTDEVAGTPSRFRRISVKVSHPDVVRTAVRAGYYPDRRAVPDGPFGASAPVAGSAAINPVLIAVKKPDYTQNAILRRLQGSVELEAVVLGDGNVGDVRVTKALELELDQQAIQAAKQWRFEPGTRNGIRGPMPVVLVVNFILR